MSQCMLLWTALAVDLSAQLESTQHAAQMSCIAYLALQACYAEQCRMS